MGVATLVLSFAPVLLTLVSSFSPRLFEEISRTLRFVREDRDSTIDDIPQEERRRRRRLARGVQVAGTKVKEEKSFEDKSRERSFGRRGWSTGGEVRLKDVNANSRR